LAACHLSAMDEIHCALKDLKASTANLTTQVESSISRGSFPLQPVNNTRSRTGTGTDYAKVAAKNVPPPTKNPSKPSVQVTSKAQTKTIRIKPVNLTNIDDALKGVSIPSELRPSLTKVLKDGSKI